MKLKESEEFLRRFKLQESLEVVAQWTAQIEELQLGMRSVAISEGQAKALLADTEERQKRRSLVLAAQVEGKNEKERASSLVVLEDADKEYQQLTADCKGYRAELLGAEVDAEGARRALRGAFLRREEALQAHRDRVAIIGFYTASLNMPGGAFQVPMGGSTVGKEKSDDV